MMLRRIFFILFFAGLAISNAAAQYTWEVVKVDSFLQSLSCGGQFCATTGYQPGQGHSVLTSDDWGQTWKTIIPVLPDSLYNEGFTAVSRVDSAHLFVIGYNGLFLSSSDAGATWSGKAIDLLVDFIAVHFADSLSGICIGNKSSFYVNQLFTTTDGGKAWTPIPMDIFYDLRSCYAAGGKRFKVFNRAITSIYMTEDNWETRDSIPQFDGDGDDFEDARYCEFTDGDTTIAYGTAIFRTITNGQIWERTELSVVPHQTISLQSMTTADRDTIIAAGSKDNLFVSFDNGATWVHDTMVVAEVSTSFGVLELAMLDNGTVVGIISRTGDVQSIIIGKRTPATVSVNEATESVAAYPNPAHTFVTLDLPSDVSSLHILDALGRVVKTYDVLLAGPHQVDVSAFGPGSYQAVAQSAAGVSSSWFIVVK